MKKFQFSLEKLSEYKNILLTEAKNELAILQGSCNKLLARVSELEAQAEHLRQEIRLETSQGTTMVKLQSFQYQLENARYQIDLLLAEIKKIENQIQRQRQVVIKLSQETAGLEKLEEQQLEDYLQEVAKANELVIAEYVSSKYTVQETL